jgi:hypothetical protein
MFIDRVKNPDGMAQWSALSGRRGGYSLARLGIADAYIYPTIANVPDK